MKALVVCDDAEVIAQLDTALQQYGIDTILYRWLLKALDNIEEISPDFTIISASDYPRHWKTLSQFINSGIGRAANKIILYTPEPLPSEERKKADALGIRGCFASLDKCEGGLETLHSFLGIKECEEKSGTTDKTLSASPSAPNNTDAADEKSALAAVSENEETELPDTQEISTEESPLEMDHGTENTVSNPDIANPYAFKKTTLESTVGSDTVTSRTNIKEATDKSAAEADESAPIEERTAETAASTEETLCDSAPLPKNACVETADSEIPQEKTENTDLDTETPETKTAAQTEETSSVAESRAETVESAPIEEETTESAASTEETLCDSAPLPESAYIEPADSEIPEKKTENEDLDTTNSEAETTIQTNESHFEPPLNTVAPESDTTVYEPPETETAFADEAAIPSVDEILSKVTQETKIHEAVLSSGEETIISTHDEDNAFPLNENEAAECKTFLNGAKEITADALAAPPAGASDLPSTKKPEKKRLVVKSDAKAAQGSLFPKANCTPAFIERFFQKLQSEALSTKAKNSSAHTASEYPETSEKDASSLDCKLPSVNSIAKETDGDTRSCLKIPRVDTLLTETASAYELCSEKNEKAPLPDYKIPAADSILKDESFLDDMRRDYRIPNVFSVFSDKNDLTTPPQTDIRIPSVTSLLQTTETAGDLKNAEEEQGRKSLLHKIEKIYEK